ncbi:hypothetical protein PsalMR5_03845 [Piscirickettsia salmonis]|nr:hypothetical protein PsalSR1_03846 [Piscirickettsia salmonis]QGP57769.1 hypothetical protein PsalBI1_00313 [Piscirickettsia salmonis]QGP65931.1 hypothetical protein PsalMR5_03845 [Piscirickettsia salmonis]
MLVSVCGALSDVEEETDVLRPPSYEVQHHSTLSRH